jgi:N-ethylmaleimide reductase
MSDLMLLTPYESESLQLQNRVVMAPLTRCRTDNPSLAPNEMQVIYYTQRASAGLLISEGTPISAHARGFIYTPGIYTREQIQAWRKVTKSIHKHDSHIFCQLWHVGRMSHIDLIGRPPLAPSAINANDLVYTHDGFIPTSAPREMSIDEIDTVIDQFCQAAINALDAGFDGIEVHASNGYLLHQFFAACANHRSDAYGGSIENRSRILFEILDRLVNEDIIQKCGVRLNPSFHNLFGITVDKWTIPTFEYIVNRLNDYPLAYLHLSEPFTSVENIPNAITNIASHFRPLYNSTLIINGGFTRDSAEQVLSRSEADLVAFGKPFIANPDLVERFASNVSLAEADPNTFYTQGPQGYIDYPKWNTVTVPKNN